MAGRAPALIPPRVLDGRVTVSHAERAWLPNLPPKGPRAETITLYMNRLPPVAPKDGPKGIPRFWGINE